MTQISFILLLCIGTVAHADLDGASQEALKQTADVLKDPTKRDSAFAENPKYKEGEKGADLLFRGNEAQKLQLYEMAAEVLQKLAETTGGDPMKMQEIAAKAQQNPEKFMNEYFTDAQKKQVRELANQIEKDRQPKSQSPSK